MLCWRVSRAALGTSNFGAFMRTKTSVVAAEQQCALADCDVSSGDRPAAAFDWELPMHFADHVGLTIETDSRR